MAWTRLLGYFRKPLATGGVPALSGVTRLIGWYLGSRAESASTLVAVPPWSGFLLHAARRPPLPVAAAAVASRTRKLRRLVVAASTGFVIALPVLKGIGKGMRREAR